MLMGLPRWHGGKESACQCRRCKRCEFNPWVRRFPWRRRWQPTPVFLSGESNGQRSLAGYSPRSHKELDTTEQLSARAHTHTHTHTHTHIYTHTQYMLMQKYSSRIKEYKMNKVLTPFLSFFSLG